MEVGEVPKGIRWSAEAGGPPKVRISGSCTRGWGRHNKRHLFIVRSPPRGLPAGGAHRHPPGPSMVPLTHLDIPLLTGFLSPPQGFEPVP